MTFRSARGDTPLTKCCVSVASLFFTVVSKINFQYLLPNSRFIAGKTDAQIDKNSTERDKYSRRRCPGPQVGWLAHRFVLCVFIFRYVLFSVRLGAYKYLTRSVWTKIPNRGLPTGSSCVFLFSATFYFSVRLGAYKYLTRSVLTEIPGRLLKT